MALLPTEDFSAVEILSVGGPVHGKGSPPGGDHFSSADLRKIANATRELMGEGLRAPVKLGHGRQATEQPASGWVENPRVSADGSKLLADLRAVPAKVAALIRSGGLRRRSAELARVTSQKSGKRFDLVLQGVALLGETRPAVFDLGDIVQLYQEGLEMELVRAYEADLEFGEVFTPEDDGEGINAEALLAALSAFGVNFSLGPIAKDRLIVHEITEAAKDDRDWIVPYERLASDSFKIAARNEWKRATPAWVEVTRDLQDGESIVDGAVRTGRIDQAKRERYERTFGEDPDWIVEMIARFEPNVARAYVNTADHEAVRDYMQEVAQREGIDPKELL